MENIPRYFVRILTEGNLLYSLPMSQFFETLTQDAFHQDIAVNALFYNINTHKVEDLMGMVRFSCPF